MASIDEPRRRDDWVRRLLIIGYTLFILGGLFFGYVFYQTLKDVVAAYGSQPLPVLTLPNVSLSQLGPPPAEPALPTPTATPDMTDINTWIRKGRINLLVLGLDKRDDCESPPWRSDTMILASLDSQAKTASMLSIPRDLWVDIPGYAPAKINTAHFLGEAYKYPGGGPALAMRTVERNFNLPVQYYVRLDFKGVQKIIDAVGGLDVEVDRRIYDNNYPGPNCSVISVDFEPGIQHMDGVAVVQYMRTRHDSSDFDRSKRQQEVLLALRKKVLSLGLIPHLPELLRLVGSSVDTNLSPRDIFALAQIGSQVKTEDIHTGFIDEKYITPFVSQDGQEALLPNRQKIRSLIDSLLSANSATPTVNTAAQAVAENARILIQDGTLQGLGPVAAQFLQRQGYKVMNVQRIPPQGNAPTIIIDHSGKTATLAYLSRLLRIGSSNNYREPQTNAAYDIEIILGPDFILPTSQ
ncbi:MAG: LCP family protein [Chloroflexi bacterium]|nr:LCP family protein [Chloroflexota bacterium]